MHGYYRREFPNFDQIETSNVNQSFLQLKKKQFKVLKKYILHGVYPYTPVFKNVTIYCREVYYQ